MAFEQPVLVEVAGEAADARAELFEGVEALDPQCCGECEQADDSFPWAPARFCGRAAIAALAHAA